MKTRYFGLGKGCIDPALDLTLISLFSGRKDDDDKSNFPEKSDQTRFGDLESEVKDRRPLKYTRQNARC